MTFAPDAKAILLQGERQKRCSGLGAQTRTAVSGTTLTALGCQTSSTRSSKIKTKTGFVKMHADKNTKAKRKNECIL